MQNSPARSAIDVGSVIAETYTIEALIGRGGMGAVFQATHKRLAGKKVAIKMLHAELGGDEVLARFKREADIASALDHPNIVKVEDYNVLPDGTPYIVYELLHGESLAQRLVAGPLTLDHATSILRQIGSALAAAHRAGIVHRDLKPQNIFLVPSEVDGHAVEIAKVLDFGISKMLGSQTVKTQEASLLGTPQYMAPEQATGQHSIVDERTDVFALGAIVYEMLTGHPAFTGASIPEVVFKVVYEQPAPIEQEVPSLPAAIAAAVKKAMEKASSDRFATVSVFVEAMTGQPLTIVHRGASASLGPADAPSTGSGKSAVKGTGKDAFAQTMGSGDHGESPVAAFAQTMDSGDHGESPASALVSAPTVASISKSASAAPVTAAPTASPTATASQPAPPPQRSPIRIAGLVIGVAAIAAAGVFFAMRGGSDDHRDRDVAKNSPSEAKPDERHDLDKPDLTRPEPVEVAKPEPAKPAATEPAKRAASEPAKPATEATKPEPHKPAHPDASKPASKPEGADNEDAGDETISQRIKDAEAALHAKDYTRAEQLANAIIANESASRNQKAHAHSIHGIVECAAHNSEENARIDLRQLDGFPRARRRLINGCRAEGHLSTDE